MTQVSVGAASSGPRATPVKISELGRARRRGVNHVCTTCVATAEAGPSARPSRTRQPIRRPKPFDPTSGTMLRHHSAASPATSQRAPTLAVSAVRAIAPTANSQ